MGIRKRRGAECSVEYKCFMITAKKLKYFLINKSREKLNRVLLRACLSCCDCFLCSFLCHSCDFCRWVLFSFLKIFFNSLRFQFLGIFLQTYLRIDVENKLHTVYEKTFHPTSIAVKKLQLRTNQNNFVRRRTSFTWIQTQTQAMNFLLQKPWIHVRDGIMKSFIKMFLFVWIRRRQHLNVLIFIGSADRFDSTWRLNVWW